MKQVIKAHSTFLIDIEPDTVTTILNAMQLAKQSTLPGQSIIIEIHPGISFRYTPERPVKKEHDVTHSLRRVPLSQDTRPLEQLV